MNRQPRTKTLASEMRHRVAIQVRTKSADGEGGYTETWATSDTVWASVAPIRATQQAEYRSLGVEATHLVKMRGGVTVNEQTHRLYYDSREFEVLTVEDIQERGVMKIITCKERR